MTGGPVWLREDVYVEPLIRSWYATPLLLSPLTSAMCAANSHLPQMRSYVESPDIHTEMSRDPSFMGGPFLRLEGSPVASVQALIDWTEIEIADGLAAAAAIKVLNTLLVREASGMSMRGLYPKVPGPLQGRVELVYDVNGHPSFRVLEGALYKSSLHRLDHQEVTLRLSDDIDRPFVLSTPRLGGGPGTGELRMQVPFSSPALDELFKLRTSPRPIGEVAELLGLDAADTGTLAGMTTTEGRPSTKLTSADGVSVHHFGHACVLISTPSVTILTDPVVSSTPREGGFLVNDFPENIDVVLLTHAHPDHVVLETLLQIRYRIGQILVPRSNGQLHDPSLKTAVTHLGFRNVTEFGEFEELAVPGGAIVGVPFLGEHGDLDVRSKLAYLVRLEGRSIMCAADSFNADPAVYDQVRREYGRVDVAFVGMECEGAPFTWYYGPVLPGPTERRQREDRRLCASDAVSAYEIVRKLGATHAAVYAMGEEPWLRHITAVLASEDSKKAAEVRQFLELCHGDGIKALKWAEGMSLII